MGQSKSAEERPPSGQELTDDLARRVADRCFTPLELYSLRDVYRTIADRTGAAPVLTPAAVARFLELPDVLAASSVIFRMMTYLGALPCPDATPASLGLSQLLIAVAVMTGRHRRFLALGHFDRVSLFFRCLAVAERKTDWPSQSRPPTPLLPSQAHTASSLADPSLGPRLESVGERAGTDHDFADGHGHVRDQLELSSLELTGADDALPQGDVPTTPDAIIPCDNLRCLILLLLFVAPLLPQERLSLHPDRVAGTSLESLRSAADCVLAAFVDVEQSPGVPSSRFNAVLTSSLPFLFAGLSPLFEHFLFSPNLDLASRAPDAPPLSRPPHRDQPPAPAPSLLVVPGEILDLSALSQLSFFLPGLSLFRGLRPLFSAANDGFSIRQFEVKVFGWHAPTILLVRGSRLVDEPRDRQQAASAACSHHHQPTSSSSPADRLVFGAYVNQPWRYTNTEGFGDGDTLLFQLAPVHDVFRASAAARDYVRFTRPTAAESRSNPLPAYLSLGARPLHPASRALPPLGPVALLLDGSFAVGVFTHDPAQGPGPPAAFLPGTAVRPSARFQDRFAVDSLEVWGYGRREPAR